MIAKISMKNCLMNVTLSGHNDKLGWKYQVTYPMNLSKLMAGQRWRVKGQNYLDQQKTRCCGEPLWTTF